MRETLPIEIIMEILCHSFHHSFYNQSAIDLLKKGLRLQEMKYIVLDSWTSL